MNKLLAVIFSLIPLFAAAAPQPEPLPKAHCAAQVPFGFPTVKKTSVTEICRGSYYTVYDNVNKIPLYTSYVLTPPHAVGCEKRDNSFSSDQSLPIEFRSTSKDYAKSGYDIGHIANAADLEYSPEAQATAAIFTNAAPQLPQFNRGIWKVLEQQTRGWTVSRTHTYQVQAGALFTLGTDKYIGPNNVGVPHAFWKILTDLTTNESIVFLFPHEGSKKPLATFVTSLAEVQRQSGITIKVPQGVKYPTTLWPITQKSSGKTCTL